MKLTVAFPMPRTNNTKTNIGDECRLKMFVLLICLKFETCAKGGFGPAGFFRGARKLSIYTSHRSARYHKISPCRNSTKPAVISNFPETIFKHATYAIFFTTRTTKTSIKRLRAIERKCKARRFSTA